MGLIISSNGTGYTTATKVRNYAGLSATTDVSDADLAQIIVHASRTLSRDISLRTFNERLSGTIDGSNTVFIAPHAYIADRNLDLAVDASDVVVRTAVVNETTGAITRTVVTVSAVDSTRGAFTLAAAPASTVDWVEADYEYYVAPVYSDMLEEAANAYSAYLVHSRSKGPDKVTLAQLRDGTQRAPAGNRYLTLYQDIVRRIRAGDVAGAPRVDVNR